MHPGLFSIAIVIRSLRLHKQKKGDYEKTGCGSEKRGKWEGMNSRNFIPRECRIWSPSMQAASEMRVSKRVRSCGRFMRSAEKGGLRARR